jgi:hypothetical protein
MTATSKNYLTHKIGVVKSDLPHFNLAPIAKGIAPTCSDEKFQDYCKESEVIAEEILKNMATLIICSDFISLFISCILLVCF